MLFSDVDLYLGALKIPAVAALHEPLELWRVVGQDLCLATLDLNSGICLEENYYSQRRDYVPEGVLLLTAWGTFSH